MEITLSKTAVALARYVASGGEFRDNEIRKALGVQRRALTRAWESLEELGALSVTPAHRGRPRSDAEGRYVTINPLSWVWTAVAQLEAVV
jgi:DNA-binding HxlR family transcriptional regulator